MRIAHVSDIHVLSDYAGRPLRETGWNGLLGRFELSVMGRAKRYAGLNDRLQTLIQEVNASQPDHVVITGDLTALGSDAEFEAARIALAELGGPERVTLIPGNHDRYAQGDGAFERFFPSYEYPFVRLIGSNVAVVALDSTRVSGPSQYFYGRVGQTQLRALDKLLDSRELKDRHVVLAVHHGFFDRNGDRALVWTGLVDGPELLRIIHGRVEAVLHGHVHERYELAATADRPRIFCAGSSTDIATEGFWSLDFAGEAVRLAA